MVWTCPCVTSRLMHDDHILSTEKYTSSLIPKNIQTQGMMIDLINVSAVFLTNKSKFLNKKEKLLENIKSNIS